MESDGPLWNGGRRNDVPAGPSRNQWARYTIVTRDCLMRFHLVCLDLVDASNADHPVLRKLKGLRLLSVSRGTWLVEYTQGAEVLYSFLAASLHLDDRLIVQPIGGTLLATQSREIETWMRSPFFDHQSGFTSDQWTLLHQRTAAAWHQPTSVARDSDVAYQMNDNYGAGEPRS